MSKRIDVPKATVGYAYSGVWTDPAGELGWTGVSSVSRFDTRRIPAPPSAIWEAYACKGQRRFLCRVTLTPVLDSRGRPITKVHK